MALSKLTSVAKSVAKKLLAIVVSSKDSIADLRAYEPLMGGQQISLLGHTVKGVGGGKFWHDASDTTSTDNNGTVIVTSKGKRWKRQKNKNITPEMFGSLKGSDNLAALNAATLAIGTSGNLQLEGDYEVSAPYSFEEKVGAKITCLGLVKILSTDKTQEVMRLSGRLVTSTGMLETGYAESVTLTIADTSAVGLLFTGLARSNMGGLRQKHVGVGHKIAQETGFGFPNGQNALFSNTFQYLDTSDFTYAAFDWRSFNGGSTGNAVLNWYMSNNVEGVANICDRFGWIGTFSDLTIGQWNFESAECRHLVTISSDVDTIDADTAHIENITPTNVNDGFFFLSNDVILNIGAMALIGNKFNDTKAATYAVFRIADNTKVTVQGISERDATVTGSPNVRMVRYAGAGVTEARVSVTNTNTTFVTNLEFGTPQGMDQALFVPRIYPLSGVLIQTDSSMTWGPQVTERTVVFQGLTVSRSFIINSLREYNGAACTIVNRDATFNVNISETDVGFTHTLLPNTSVNIAFDGVNWGVV